MRPIYLLFSISAAASACAPPPAPARTPADSTPAEAAAPATASDGAKEAAPSKAAPGTAPLSAESLRSTYDERRDAQQVSFFDEAVKNLSAKIGAPRASSDATVREWWFDKKPLGKTFTCGTFELVQMPGGNVASFKSVLTSPDCAKAKASAKQVEDVEKKLDRKFDKASKSVEAALSKPALEAKSKAAVWRYTNEDNECKELVVYETLGSHTANDLWELPCE